MDGDTNSAEHGICFDVSSVRGTEDEFTLGRYGGCLKQLGCSRLVLTA
jgi:hypothetical protein